MSGYQEVQQVEAVILSLMKQLEALAPHPKNPEQSGPLFISVNSEFRPPAEYEGLMGSLGLEAGLTAAFGGVSTMAASVAEVAFNALDGMDIASEFAIDRGNAKNLRQSFNQQANFHHMVKAYFRDLPKRLGLEKWIAQYQRKLFGLRKLQMNGLIPV